MLPDLLAFFRKNIPKNTNGTPNIENNQLIQLVNNSFEKCAENRKGEPNSYIVIDDEFGYGNKIPLWLFGFLY